jgi:E3 ubiquitin-protein ligase TRIP12
MTSTPTGTGANEFADEDLPSVMTCANYLKLPPYSSKVSLSLPPPPLLSLSLCACVWNSGGCGLKDADETLLVQLQEVMYKKLLYAINEGQGSFDLS